MVADSNKCIFTWKCDESKAKQMHDHAAQQRLRTLLKPPAVTTKDSTDMGRKHKWELKSLAPTDTTTKKTHTSQWLTHYLLRLGNKTTPTGAVHRPPASWPARPTGTPT